MADLFSNVTEIQWQMVVMWVIGGLLIWLAIKKEMEPTLLLPWALVQFWLTCLVRRGGSGLSYWSGTRPNRRVV